MPVQAVRLPVVVMRKDLFAASIQLNGSGTPEAPISVVPKISLLVQTIYRVYLLRTAFSFIGTIPTSSQL